MKQQLTDDDVHVLRETVKRDSNRVSEIYNVLRTQTQNTAKGEDLSEFTRQADTAQAAASDILQEISVVFAEVDDDVEFNAEERRRRLRSLKTSYAASIYSARTATTVASTSQSVRSQIIQERINMEKTAIALEAHKAKQRIQGDIDKIESEKRQKLEAKRAEMKSVDLQMEYDASSAGLQVLQEYAQEDQSDQESFGDANSGSGQAHTLIPSGK